MLSFAEQTEERRFQRWFSSRRYGPDLTWCLISALLCVCVQCERYFDVSEDIQMPLRMHWYIRVVGVCRALPLIIGLVIRSKSYAARHAQRDAQAAIGGPHTAECTLLVQLANKHPASPVAPLIAIGSLAIWLPPKRGICAETCRRAFLVPGPTNKHVQTLVSLFEAAKDLGSMLAMRPLHMLPPPKSWPVVPLPVNKCHQTCGVFVTTSALLVMLAVLYIAARAEWHARREFLREHGRSEHSITEPSLLVALQHWWLLGLCTWAVGIATLD